MGHRGEHIAGMRCCTLNAVSVVDTTVSGLSIHIKVLQVVVEIHGSSTQISAEKSSVGGEDGRHINTTPFA